MSKHAHHGSQAQTRGAVSLIFSFFLSLVLVMVMLLAVARVGVLSEGGFVSLFDDEYYEYVLRYASDKATYYTYPTGIAPNVIDGVFTTDEIRRDVTGTVLGAFRGTGYHADLTDAEGRLSEHVTSFLEDGGVETSGDDMGEIISTYVGEIMDIYLGAVKLPGLDVVARLRSRYLNYLTVGLFACVALAVILVVSLRRLHHFAHRSLRYVAYATGGASLMCLIAPVALYLSGAYRGIKLKPQHFYHFGVSVASRVLVLTIAGGIVLAAATIILIMVIARMRTRLIRHSSEHRHSW